MSWLYKCIRECPVKAIKIENGHASVIPDKCIACGNCVKACPSNAKRVRSDIAKAKNLILAQKKVFVSLAPSWSGVFEHSPKKMIAILKSLGFSEVSETALGAQEVSIKTAEILNSAERWTFYIKCLPCNCRLHQALSSWIFKSITPIGSPAMTHAKILREKYGDDISIVFIGPCIGKKNEVSYTDLIDVALTFEELKIWIHDEGLDVAGIISNEDNKFVPYTAFEGALYPIDGGMNETLKRIGVKTEFN